MIKQMAPAISDLPEPMIDILREVAGERLRHLREESLGDYLQVEWVSILADAVGVVATNANGVLRGPAGDRPEFLEMYRESLLNTAALVVAAVESFDRTKWRRE